MMFTYFCIGHISSISTIITRTGHGIMGELIILRSGCQRNMSSTNSCRSYVGLRCVQITVYESINCGIISHMFYLKRIYLGQRGTSRFHKNCVEHWIISVNRAVVKIAIFHKEFIHENIPKSSCVVAECRLDQYTPPVDPALDKPQTRQRRYIWHRKQKQSAEIRTDQSSTESAIRGNSDCEWETKAT